MSDHQLCLAMGLATCVSTLFGAVLFAVLIGPINRLASAVEIIDARLKRLEGNQHSGLRITPDERAEFAAEEDEQIDPLRILRPTVWIPSKHTR